MTHRRATVVLVAGLMLASCQRDASPPEVHPQANVLLITLDTTRADRLGCYGYPRPNTPNLDRLAASGTRFSQAIAQASVTPVSHASILTGLNPYVHGLRVMHGLEGNRLPDEIVTLAEILRDAGLVTGAFVSAFPVTERFGLDQGFGTFEAGFMRDDPEDLFSPRGTITTGENQRRADETTDLALDWLDRVEEPFLLWLHYFDPHDIDLVPPGVELEQFEGSLPAVLRELYDIEIRFMDEQIGRVLEALRSSSREDSTVVVAVSDHGEGLGDHGWWTHGLLYQEQIHVPLILRAPGGPTGIRVDALVRTIDIVPTVLDLLGLSRETWPLMDGESLVPLMDGTAPNPRYVAYADSVNTNLAYSVLGERERKDEIYYAIVDPPWKYVRHVLRAEESELYDLDLDPGEHANLFLDRPGEASRLASELDSRPYQPDASSQEGRLTEEELERLRSLGYVQ